MSWFDILKVEDEFTPFEEWAKSLSISSDDPVMNPFRGIASHLQETVNNLIEHGRAQRAGEGRGNTLNLLTDAYGSQVRAFLTEGNPEPHERAMEMLSGIVEQSDYAEVQGDIISLTPTWLDSNVGVPEPYDTMVDYLLEMTCVDEDDAMIALDSVMPIISIDIDTVNLEVNYIMGNNVAVEVCLHRNLLPSGDQIGFLVLAARESATWVDIWEGI
jgi:hypothetical protein